MLDMVATNDIIYTQRNKITGVAGFTVTLSTNHLSTDGALAQVKINGAFVRNTFGDVTLAANTRGVTTTISDMLIISVASASKTDSNNDLTVRNSIQIDNSSIEGDNILALAGNSKVSDPLSTGYLLANDNVSFTMVGVAQIPLVNSGAKARQINTILIDGVATNGSLIKAQRNVRLETNPSMLDQAKVNGSVQVIGLNLNPTVKLAAGVVDKASSKVATSSATRIIAGVNNAANVFVIPAELLKALAQAGVLVPPTQANPTVSFDPNSPAVKAILEKLLGANSTSLNGAGGTVNIDVRYELTAFRAQDIEVNVTTGMIIKKGNDYYYYDSLDSRNLNLATENYGNSYWKKNPPADAGRQGRRAGLGLRQLRGRQGGQHLLRAEDGGPGPAGAALRQPAEHHQPADPHADQDAVRARLRPAGGGALPGQHRGAAAAAQEPAADGQQGPLPDSFYTFYVDIPNLYASGGSVYVSAADTSG